MGGMWMSMRLGIECTASVGDQERGRVDFDKNTWGVSSRVVICGRFLSLCAIFPPLLLFSIPHKPGLSDLRIIQH